MRGALKPVIGAGLTGTLIAVCGFAVLQDGGRSRPGQDYRWELPAGFPKPLVPADNPMSAQKVQLGRYLFYDKRMSVNGKEACASCHRQELAFTDGKARAAGATGEIHPRGSMSLVNVAYSAALTWGNPGVHGLEGQALTPMFGEHPLELGLTGDAGAFLDVLRADRIYREMFPLAYPDDAEPFSIQNVTRALACFERSIISGRSPYDRYHYGGDDGALSEAAKRGETLFFSEPLSCFRCHGGFNFSDATASERSGGHRAPFHNNGVSYAEPNTGTYEYTHNPDDMGKFKAPTLRNIALTAPYMHDGGLATLGEVLDHYASGGRHYGNQDPLVRGFSLTAQGKADLLAFLESLTDREVIQDPRFANPWK